ncbi:asparaginase [Cryobacterium tepidiphilum]|uniref:Asparaginase n=1 Tax=Cryobacterium tepidiphilum TaxID=2486026 RepID=A0A3M8LHC4_9MICO|nr:asparaginase [Cryobacterium tepidiphilum]RNE64152.1 asparaginase [Cryobacterium tepidiphilum]
MPDSSSSTTDTGPIPGYAELAEVWRSGMIESRHFGSLVALDAAGHAVLDVGATDAEILPRSTVKPLQALACLTAGAPLAGVELAIAAGSHTGEDEHVRVVRAILARAGLDESALGCPADRPEDEATFEAMIRAGEGRSPIRMNCSGKHAAMLLACAVNGWSTHDYLDPGHPLQQHVRTTMAELTGVPVTHTAVDGCGLPLFTTTVRGIAAAFRALVLAAPDEPAGAVAAAMREHPFYVGGSGHQNSELMSALPGVLAKGGAEGVIGVAGPDGSAVSMKIIDGSPRATTLIALRVLEFLGIPTAGAASLSVLPVLGGGVPVGEVVPGSDLVAAIDGARA